MNDLADNRFRLSSHEEKDSDMPTEENTPEKEAPNFAILLDDTEEGSDIKRYIQVEDGFETTAKAKTWIKKNLDDYEEGSEFYIVRFRDPIRVKAVAVKSLIE